MTFSDLSNQASQFTLLYIEDDLQLQESMKIFFEQFFKSVTLASNGQEGLDRYKETPYDLIVTDIKMPILDGIEMTKQIKKINPKQSIIIFTAFDNTEIYLDIIKLNVDGFILKPFAIEQMKETLNKVLQNLVLENERNAYEEKLKQEVAQKTKELQKQKDELEIIFNTSKDGIAILDLQSNFLNFNDAYLKMTGFTREELLKKSCMELSILEDLPRAKAVFEETLRVGFYENFIRSCKVKGGRVITTNISMALLPNKTQFIISTKDITQAKINEQKLKDHALLIDKNIITSTTDLDGIMTEVSDAFCKASGYTKEELIGQNHSIMRHPDMSDELFKKLWETISQDKIFKAEIKNKKKNGSLYWTDSSIFPIYDTGKKVGYTTIRQLITDKKLIEEISITDGLTNIFNRRHFNTLFPNIINKSKRNNELLCFLMLDIDFFKRYNDTYGHQKGDETLKRVASAIEQTLQRADDYCFRLGGEEFGIIFRVKQKKDALLFANKIRQNIQDLRIEHEKNSIKNVVTVSIRLVSKYVTTEDNQDNLYKEADTKLYQAKERGRNRVVN